MANRKRSDAKAAEIGKDQIPMRKRRRATQQRTLDTQRRILDAAAEEFAEKGYDGASTRAIATSVGLQHTLVTYHFKGKEGLWRAVVADILIEYSKTVQLRLDGLRGVDSVTKLKLVYEDFIRFSARNLPFHRIMSHIASAPSRQLDWLIEAYLRNTFDSRAALIRDAQKAGRFVDGDPYHLEYVFIGAITRIFMLSAEVEKIMGRSPFAPAFVDEHVRVCIGLFFREPPTLESGAGKSSGALARLTKRRVSRTRSGRR